MKTASPYSAWQQVHKHAQRIKNLHLRDLFAKHPRRFDRFSFALDDLTVDLSAEKLDTSALDALFDLARSSGLEQKRNALFAGEKINLTENRPVLHPALRGSATPPQGDDVDGTLDRFLAFASQVRQSKLSDVVTIGIGGSDLGPAMAIAALAPFRDGPRIHCVSNLDGAHIADTLDALSPETTLVVVVSRSFATLETISNAKKARRWLGRHASTNIAAVSASLERCAAFGIAEKRVFAFWNWVGGRYSVWSAAGLALAIAIGKNNFRAFLKGAAHLDQHFRSAPLEQNLPVLLGLTGIWRRNALGCPTVAVIPYDQRLARFPAYLQQLDMESNGKQVLKNGRPVTRPTAPVIWGEPGTNAQHSFFQLLHQGTDCIPVDFIVAAQPVKADPDHHALLIANCLAQRAALAFGRCHTESDSPHRAVHGDRPSTVILYRQLDPYALGRLVALYEHKVFVMGAIWGINSFDQFGVELGKELADYLTPVVRGDTTDIDLDPATRGLLDRIGKIAS